VDGVDAVVGGLGGGAGVDGGVLDEGVGAAEQSAKAELDAFVVARILIRFTEGLEGGEGFFSVGGGGLDLGGGEGLRGGVEGGEVVFGGGLEEEQEGKEGDQRLTSRSRILRRWRALNSSSGNLPPATLRKSW